MFLAMLTNSHQKIILFTLDNRPEKSPILNSKIVFFRSNQFFHAFFWYNFFPSSSISMLTTSVMEVQLLGNI